MCFSVVIQFCVLKFVKVMEDTESEFVENRGTKKKKIIGRMTDVRKK